MRWHIGAWAAVAVLSCAGLAPHGPEQRTHEDADDGAAQPVIPGEQVPQPVRERQHPLADRDVRKNLIDQMRRALSHPATAA